MNTKLTTILMLLVSITSFSQTFTVDGLNYEVSNGDFYENWQIQPVDVNNLVNSNLVSGIQF